MNKAQALHASVVRMVPMYQETAHWHAVWVEPVEHRELYEYLNENGLERGTNKSRNDFLVPIDNLFLFKDYKVAVEVKLKWG